MLFKSYLKNIRYILKHKYYVFIECYKMGIPLRGLVHDFSKFSPAEFKPYAMYFFGDLPKQKDITSTDAYVYVDTYHMTKEYWEDKFNLAWLHHKRVNMHHWEYWVDINDDGNIDVLEMPMVYAKEMLCDWRGAGRAISGKDDTDVWYANNKDKMILHPKTRAWIEQQLYNQ